MSSKNGYGIVIDAGSSGSRIYLYRWPKRHFHTLPPPITQVEREALFSEVRTPGISDEKNGGIDCLVELLQLAKEILRGLAVVSVSHHGSLLGEEIVDLNSVPIYLGATAGMRILDPQREETIMSNIRTLLRESGFMFRDHWARTISGEEEGAYGWLVANYLKNEGYMPDTHAPLHSHAATQTITTITTTYGALDLGGASTQISFRPSGSILSNQFPLCIGEMEYLLYTHSFLYYGVDQARWQYDTKYVHPSKTNTNPCYPTGYTNPTTNIEGSSNWSACLQTVGMLFDKTQYCYHGDGNANRCSFNGVYQPPFQDKKFIAMSSFVYTWSYLGLAIGEHTDDLEALERRSQHFCNLSYEEQLRDYDDRRKHHPNGIWVQMQGNQCFNAAYTYHLLSTGYGMPVKGTPIEIYNNINGTGVQWALGMMLSEANKLGWDYDHGLNAYKYLFVSLTPLLGVLALILGYLLYNSKQAPGGDINIRRHVYSPLETKASPPPAMKSAVSFDRDAMQRKAPLSIEIA